MDISFESSLEKKHFYLFSLSFFLEIQANYASTKQKYLILNSKQILLNYLNLVLILISIDKSNLNLLFAQPLTKFNKEINEFLNTFEKDYKNRKRLFILIEELEHNYNFYRYNQFYKAVESLSHLIEIFINTSLDSVKIKSNLKPKVVKVTQTQNLEVEINNSFIKNQFSIIDNLKEFINNKFKLNNLKNNPIYSFIEQFNKNYNISEKEIISQNHEEHPQKEDFLRIIDKEVYLVDDFMNLLKSISKLSFEENTDFFINLLNFKREENFRNLIVSNKYASFSDYLLKNFVNDGELIYKDFLKLPYYTEVLNSLCEKGELIQISNTDYWTRDRLLNSVFDSGSLTNFYRKIDQFIDIEGFISSSQILNMFPSYFSNFKNPSLFIDSLLIYEKNKKYEKFAFSEGKLYSKKEYKLSKLDLIKSFFRGGQSFDLYDVIDQIQSKYRIVYKDSLLLNDIKGSGLFYSEDTERIYLDKQMFLKEIFNNEN